MKLRDILGVLRDAYCRRVGIEYMHITDPEQRRWLQARIEVKGEAISREEQLHILGRLNVAEAFETFLQTKYVGQKRFSLEGAETVIALCDAILAQAADDDLDEVVIGMPHRGRLNVLANIVGKPYAKIFNEFEGNIDPGTAQGSGDVKYHLGADGTFVAPSGKEIAVSLTANPSHLEAVDPVLEGIVRAKQDRLNKGEAGFTVLPLMMHGDAAFAGSGRRRRDAEPVAAAGLPQRRHRPRRRQQPGRLHDVAVLVTLVALRHRHRPHDRRADLPRERRRSRSVRAGGQARRRVPPRVQQGRRDRHDLLPASRAQRGRQPVVHPAADVRHHRRQAQRPEALHRGAGRPGRHHPRRRRARAARLPAAAGEGLRRDARTQPARPRPSPRSRASTRRSTSRRRPAPR